jgi:hypothetical protein
MTKWRRVIRGFERNGWTILLVQQGRISSYWLRKENIIALVQPALSSYLGPIYSPEKMGADFWEAVVQYAADKKPVNYWMSG